ncbi:TPA: hypothetical protein N0F65_004680 [Lagenidium giganteum]|uniref:Uncharacterized protein n=1 Tax=Lagenidium giganteum TaxID=4803 RepID=A0AAV2Z504_9STRA|nr:TPA: hypothetical protein N0F65_004680 [Lagenidium giganteum]
MDGADHVLAFAAELDDVLHHFLRRRRIQTGRRLIQQQHGWVGQQLDGDTQTLELTARDALVEDVANTCTGAVTQTHVFNDVLDTHFTRHAWDVVGQTQASSHLQGLEHGERSKERHFLGHVVHHRTERAWLPWSTVNFDDAFDAARGVNTIGQDVEQRRLTSTGWTDDGSEISRGRAATNVLENAALVAAHDGLGLEH